MLDTPFEICYLIVLLIYLFGIDAPHKWRNRREEVSEDRTTIQNVILMLTAYTGWQALPLIYIFAPWLDFADYARPDWLGWGGVIALVAALWLNWRAHIDLGRNWSATLRVTGEHTLITEGVYHRIRHPMYTSIWLLWGVANLLLFPNWIAGSALLVLFVPLYIYRVPREEQMMLDHFGDEYRAYMQRTGRLIPKLR